MNETDLPILDLLLSLSEITDLINPAVANHHRRVGYISSRLAEQLEYSPQQTQDVVVAAVLHDIGAFSLSEKLRLLHFECDNTQSHSEAGYLLLRTFSPIEKSANIVRYHHAWWHATKETDGLEIPHESRAVFLADRVAVLIRAGKNILSQVPGISRTIIAQSGKMFDPACVEAFEQLARQEDFWLDIIYQPLKLTLETAIKTENIKLTPQACTELAELFRKTIDFRSHFTATHSSGVAASAAELARVAGFTTHDIKMMRLAGNLHDLGKLAVPAEILEKNAKLNRQELFIMRAHTYHTDRLLKPIPAFDTIRAWASLHHERLDGKGYPFHVAAEELSLGSRIMAVADIFVALCEDRPYRTGLPETETMSILRRMSENDAIDGEMVDLVKNKFEQINETRKIAQNSATQEFNSFVTFSAN